MLLAASDGAASVDEPVSSWPIPQQGGRVGGSRAPVGTVWIPSTPMSRAFLPSIVVTLGDPSCSRDAAAARRKSELYLDAVRRAGGAPVGIDETTSTAEATAAFSGMDGLLLSGGTDLDPALYGAELQGSVGIRPDRDQLELAAWGAATKRGLPVLGICRGLQAINVFMGGGLAQHVEGHQGPSFGEGRPATHLLRLVAGSLLARILTEGVGSPDRVGHPDGATVLPSYTVNSYHHQAVRPGDLAPGLLAVGFTTGGDGELVEAPESAHGRWLIGVQFHPERTESTPPEFERLFAAFVRAASERDG